MTEKYRTLERCRVCGSTNLKMYLDLGKMPLANALLPANDPHKVENEEKFPLEVLYCMDCSLSQLSIVVDPDIMFRDYVYRSSISTHFQHHCAELAEELLKDGKLNPSDLVVDVASNDGCLLNEFKKKGLVVAGVDPAVNLAAIATEQGIPTLPEYWTPELATKILNDKGKAKVILLVNVFAHIDELHSTLEGIKILLDKDGTFIIESPHMESLIEKAEFDTIYHEHLSYLLAKPLQRLMAMHDLRLEKIVKSDIHGGSIRLYIVHAQNPAPVHPSVEAVIREENAKGLHSYATYESFREKVEHIRTSLVGMLSQLKKEGKTIAAFGASAKGNVLLNYCGIGKDTIQFIVDDTPEKKGKLYPGVHIPIVPRDWILEKQPDYLVILAWNFAKEIMEKTQEYHSRGGKYIVPIPVVQIKG